MDVIKAQLKIKQVIISKIISKKWFLKYVKREQHGMGG